jgi:hypothetical protein
MRISAVSLAATLVIAVACRDEKVPALETIDIPRDVPKGAGTFGFESFKSLRFLEGRWRGTMPDGKPFFEEYRFLDDTTILKLAYADATFAKSTDSSRIELRDSTVADMGKTSRYVASRLDSLGADFIPQFGATNTFTWAKESPTRWLATIRWTDRNGQPQSVVYPMERVR